MKRIWRGVAAAVVSLGLLGGGLAASEPSTSPNPVAQVAGFMAPAAYAAPTGGSASDPGAGVGAQAGQEANDPNAVDQDSCAEKAGAFAWMLCPFFDGVSHSFAEGAKDLISGFLAVQPLEQKGPIYDTWNGVRLLSNVAFIIAFLVFIFAQTLRFNIDAYALKKILPKLVASAILVQFSFIIASAIIDVGNILGAGVGDLIGSITANGPPGHFNVTAMLENLAIGATLVILASVVVWPLAFSLTLMVLIAIVALILTLALRYFILGVLIIVAPLAFAAWVLPNTEDYFSKWLNTFIKLVLMYPIIIALLSVAANVDGLVPAAASAGAGSPLQNTTTSIIKVLVFIACFAAVTQTFKWAGGAMSAAASAMDKARSAGHKAVKESDRYKEAKAKSKSQQVARAAAMSRFLDKAIPGEGKLASGAKAGLLDAGGILFAGRMASGARSRHRDSSALIKEKESEIKDMKISTPDNMKNALLAYYGTTTQQREARADLKAAGAESLMHYTSNLEGRQALMRRLADKNMTGDKVANAILGSGHKADYQALLDENGRNFGDSPGLWARHKFTDASKNNVLDNPQQMGDVNGKAIKSALAGMTAARFGSNDFKLDTLSVAANNKPTSTARERDISQQMARLMGQELSLNVAEAFDPANAKPWSNTPATKRAELLKALARNKEQFTVHGGAHGLQLWNTIVGHLLANQAAYTDEIKLIDGEDDHDHIRNQLGI